VGRPSVLGDLTAFPQKLLGKRPRWASPAGLTPCYLRPWRSNSRQTWESTACPHSVRRPSLSHTLALLADR